MVAMTSFHADKCCYLVNAHSVCSVPTQQRPPVPGVQYIRTCYIK